MLSEAGVRGLPGGPRPLRSGSCSLTADSQWTGPHCLKEEGGTVSCASDSETCTALGKDSRQQQPRGPSGTQPRAPGARPAELLQGPGPPAWPTALSV